MARFGRAQPQSVVSVRYSPSAFVASGGFAATATLAGTGTLVLTGTGSFSATAALTGTGSGPGGVPAAPLSVSAMGASGNISVSWVPGDATATSFIITPYLAGSAGTPKTAGGSATSCAFTGLGWGSTYVFGVVAVNAHGNSPATYSLPYTAPSPVVTVAGAGQVAQPFTYLLCDLVSGAIKGEAPFAGVSFGKTLNGTGQFQGTLNLADPNLAAMDVLDMTQPGRTALFVDYNGSLVWGGAILPRSYDWDPQRMQLTITAPDLWTYFASRVQATDYSAPPYSGITGPSTPMTIWNAANSGSPPNLWDAVLMAWQVISDALQLPGLVPASNILGGLSIAANSFTTTAGYLGSGTATPAASYVAQTFPFSSLQTVDTIVNQLSQLGLYVGFDRGLDVAYSNGPLSVPIGTVNLSYPRRGRSVAQNNLVVDLSTARKYSFPEDATQMADILYETGSAGAICALENIYPLQQGWPVLERVISRSQITSAAVLQLLSQIGMSDLFLYSYPPVVPQLTLDLFGQNPALGSFVEGDDILVMIPNGDGKGNAWDPRFPAGLFQEWRITQWVANVADDGDSTMQLTFNQPVATSITQPVI